MAKKITAIQHAKLVDGMSKIIAAQGKTAGAKAVTFFKGNFRRAGFPMNANLERWAKRNQPDYRPGGALLIRTGKLRRSIRVAQATTKRVKVATNLPYAEAHNEGMTVTTTARVPAHTRKAHDVKAHTRRGRRGVQAVPGHRRKEAQVGAHSRKLNLTHKRRQFIGHSPDLMKSIEREYIHQVRALEKQIFG